MEVKICFKLIIGFVFIVGLGSCETDHTFQKIVLNNSELSFSLRYNNNSFYTDSLFTLHPGASVKLVDWWKRGNHPESSPLSSCGMTDEDSLFFSFDSAIPFAFIGDFTDENRWESDFESGRSSTHICTFMIVNEDFAY